MIEALVIEVNTDKLREMGLDYEPHLVDFSKSDQLSPAFLSLNPNNKIPAIIDPNGPDGRPLPLFESGAILLYLAEKTGKFLPTGADRWTVIQWLMFQMGGLGPMFGQLGFFHHFAGKEIADPRPKARYVAEAKRILAVLERQLMDREWIAGEYSIADMAIGPWLRALTGVYEAADLVGWAGLRATPAYLTRFLARAAVQRGLTVPARS